MTTKHGGARIARHRTIGIGATASVAMLLAGLLTGPAAYADQLWSEPSATVTAATGLNVPDDSTVQRELGHSGSAELVQAQDPVDRLVIEPTLSAAAEPEAAGAPVESEVEHGPQPPARVEGGVLADSADHAVPEPTVSNLAEQGVANAPGDVAPIAAPVIHGDPVVGGTLTSTGGEWNGAAWLHFTWDANGENVLTESLPVGTHSTLQLTNLLADASIHLTVGASLGEDGPGTEARAASVTVRAGTFENVSWTAAINGGPKVGQTLSATPPIWNGPFEMRAGIGYQWYRGAAAIAGATRVSYTTVAADSGQLLSVNTTLSLSGYAPLMLSSEQLTVAAGIFTAAPVPTVTGTARVGQLQSASAGIWAPSGAVLSYQWYRGSSAISGATGRTYTTVAADNGAALKVRVRATKAGFVTTDKNSAARTVAAGIFTATKSVTTTGAYRFGQTLRISQGWSPSPASTRYQWYRNGVAIKGGTETFLYLNSSYIGAKISVKVTVVKAGYASRSISTVGAVVRNATITSVNVPKITGTLKAGSTLVSSNGSYSPGVASVSYQWYRNGAAISGARSRSYTLISADNGKSITVKVTARKPLYEAKVVASAAVTVPMPPVTVISRDGTYSVGTWLKPGLYKATGGGTSCYWERLSGFSGNFSQIRANYFGTARTYVQVSAGDAGFSTSRCGSWTTVSSTGAKATKITADGTYRVGVDILPGTYYGSSAGRTCYTELVTGFGGTFNEIIDNYFGSALVILEIPASAKGVSVSSCGTLTRR